MRFSLPVVGLCWLASGCGAFGLGQPAQVESKPAVVADPTTKVDPASEPVIADIEARKDVCGVAWANTVKPEPAMTMRCMGEWLTIGYGGRVDFTLDPTAGASEELPLTADQLELMANHVRPFCPSIGGEPRACERAIEYFGRAATVRFDLLDTVTMASFEPLLSKVLHGQSVSKADLIADEGYAMYRPVTLWRLRNAVFARHGRPFKHPDLQRFFYGDGVVPSPLLPVLLDESYSDQRLTDVDRANLSVIQAAEGT